MPPEEEDPDITREDLNNEVFKGVLEEVRPDQQVSEINDVNKELEELKSNLQDDSLEILKRSMELTVLVERVDEKAGALMMLTRRALEE